MTDDPFGQDGLDAPRMLVEGGPVHRRIKMILAILIGWTIGASIGVGGTAIVALKASHEVKASRVRATLLACEESNERAGRRHTEAKAGLEALVVKTKAKSAKPLTRAQKLEQRVVLEGLVEAIAPKSEYTAGKGTLREREAAGCAARVRSLNKP